MVTLLVLIYVSFISLGLPDSLLGAAWPSIAASLALPVSMAGTLSMLTAAGTILSSLCNAALIRRLGTGRVTLISVGLTAAALMGISFSTSFFWLCVWAIPLGLGGGSVDVALNNFVANHYRAMHMSWLHCFWGVGATLGPWLISLCLRLDGRWQSGYRLVSLLQFALTGVLLFSLPLWKKLERRPGTVEGISTAAEDPLPLWRRPGFFASLACFLCYGALEVSSGLWGASYFVEVKGLSPEIAAGWGSFFYCGIMVGRLLSGFLSIRIGAGNLIRMGLAGILLGVALLLAGTAPATAGAALLLIGLGCAPIYPSLMHRTPKIFGAAASQTMIGFQTACGYLCSTFIPVVFGLIAQSVGLGIFPLALLLFFLLLTAATERVTYIARRQQSAQRQL